MIRFLLADDEELVRANELQGNYAKVLDRAVDHPVSVPRGGAKEDVTLIARSAWQSARHSLRYQAILVQLSSVLADRLVGNSATPYPSGIEWLSVFEDQDVAEFVHEFTQLLNAVSAGVRKPSALQALLVEWYRSAIALQDEHLQARILEAREQLV